MRSRIVLGAAEGRTKVDIAAEVGCSGVTVSKWRNRFAHRRIDGLYDEPRPGPPRQIDDAKVEEVLTKTLEETPRDATHWSTRSMAKAVGLSQSSISRIWRAFGLKPHRTEHFLKTPPRALTDVTQMPGSLYTGRERVAMNSAAWPSRIAHHARVRCGLRPEWTGRR